MALSISQLPVELIHAIALSFDPHERRSATHIVRLRATSHHLRSTLQASHLWSVLYSAQYPHANPETEAARRALRQGDYLLLFQDRRRLDAALLAALDHLIDTGQRVRLSRALAALRYDVQDVLESLARPVTSAAAAAASLSRFIARERWAAHARVLLERLSAVEVFTSLKDDPDAVSFERGLMALSQFEGISMNDLHEALSLLHQRCQADLRLRSQWTPGSPLSMDLALAICASMRREGFLPATPERYHDMENHYPHKFLMTNHQTLPMSLVWTFVCLATRFGFDARPVGYPGTVIAAVKPPESNEWHYINLFREELTTQTEAELSASLQPGFPRDFIQPATTQAIISRAVNNVFVSAMRETTVQWRVLYLVFVFFASQGIRDNTTNSLWTFIRQTANERAPLDIIPILHDRLLGPNGASFSPGEAYITLQTAKLKCGEEEMPRRVVRAPERWDDSGRRLAVGMMIGPAQFIVGLQDSVREVTVLDCHNKEQPLQEFPYLVAADQWRGALIVEEGPTQSENDLFEIGMAAVNLLGHNKRLFQGLEIKNGKVRLVLSTTGKQQYPEDDGIAQRWMEEEQGGQERGLEQEERQLGRN